MAERTREDARQERRRDTETARKRLEAEYAKFDDWRGRCRHCGEELMGTLAELRGHVCGT